VWLEAPFGHLVSLLAHTSLTDGLR
jgi:hypothetical protein